MLDLPIKCQDCGQEFVWTADEQEYYKEKGLSRPKTCLICRSRRQARDRQFQKYQKSTDN